jgi:hypothetical protein
MNDQYRRPRATLRMPVAMTQYLHAILHLKKAFFRFRQEILATEEIARQSLSVAIAKKAARNEILNKIIGVGGHL